MLEHTDKGMRLDYEIDISDQLRLSVAEEDLTEVLGPLLENAVRFARRAIRVTGKTLNNSVHLSVEDDGPGIKQEDVAEVMSRGARLDQVNGGHGLGLAIASEFVEASGGEISLSTSLLGGLSVNLVWKIAAVVDPKQQG